MEHEDIALKARALHALGREMIPDTPPLAFQHRALQNILTTARNLESQQVESKVRLLPEVEREILEKYGIEG